jgi:hypothetical protein
MRDLCGAGNVLNLECICVNVLVVMLCNSFVRSCRMEKMGKKNLWDLFVKLLTNASGSIIILK